MLNAQNNAQIIGLEKQIQTKPAKSLNVINKMLASKTLTSFDKATLLAYKGEIYKKNQHIFKAIELFKESYALFKKPKYTKKQIEVLNSISNLYVITENFSEIIENQKIIGTLINNSNDKALKSNETLLNMALMYFKAGDMTKAKSYLNKVIKISFANNNYNLLNNSYKDLSRVYIATNQLDSALYITNKALKYSLNNNSHQLTAALLLNKGEIFEHKESYIEAEKHYEKAIKYLNLIKINNADTYIKLGNFYKKVRLYSFANKYLNKAIKKTLKTGNNEKITSLYHDLMENAILEKKPNKAFYYLMKYDSLNNINLKEEKKRNIDYINKKYNIQKEEILYLKNKNILKERENELSKQKQITKRNKLVYIFLLALASLMILTGLLYYRFYKLKNEKQNLQLKNTVLRLQMNPHFIFNSLTAIQNTILKDDKLKSAELIAIFSTLIRQNLDFSHQKSILLSEEIDMLTNYLKTQQFRFNNTFSYDINIDHKIDIDDIEIPPMLIQPFVENAIEHGLKHNDNKHGEINININKVNDGVKITITDNGIGFSKGKLLTKKQTDRINAIDIFKERLKIRNKNEEVNFKINEIINVDNQIVGTKVSFILKN